MQQLISFRFCKTVWNLVVVNFHSDGVSFLFNILTWTLRVKTCDSSSRCLFPAEILLS